MRLWKKILIIVAVNAVAFVAYLILGDRHETAKPPQIIQIEYIRSCVQGNYETVARYPDSQKGKNMYVSGTVIQVIEAADHVELRLQETVSNVWYIVYQYKTGEAHILEGDRLTVYGPCNGTITYNTIYGQPVTVPYINAYYVQ